MRGLPVYVQECHAKNDVRHEIQQPHSAELCKAPTVGSSLFFKACREYDRRKEKLFYCAANLVSYLVAIGELVYFGVQTFRGVVPDKRAVLVLPVALFFGINSSIPYLVPDFYGNEWNIEKEKASNFAVLLFLMFGYCMFMT